MHRFYLTPEQCLSPNLVLEDREAHHALHVLRTRQGERVSVLDGAGKEFLCEVQLLGRDRVQLLALEQRSISPPPHRITLLQALPKGRGFESIVQKATELGTHRIVPLLAERVAARFDDESAAHKVEKWRLAAIEAIKQCGSAWLPQIEAPIPLAQFLARHEKFDLPLIASLQAGSHHARECFSEFQAGAGRKPQSVAVWVGPEGDFTPEEVAAIVASGARPITLGRLVLRSETAAVYCLSIANHELQSAA